ncbi:MAG: rRNA maturation RNase YbeY [Putridiphycobacter sp.]|nr:rRNA maturation RNase YbeY [Putridiphycobacter sp.]
MNPEFLRLWLTDIAKNCDKSIGELCYIFCSDEYLLKINKEYLNHDYYTDIITFNYNQGEVISGDIFISIDTVRSNAREYAQGNEQIELFRVMAHGMLHLCGYNDKTDSEQLEMTKMEDWALEELKRFT